MVKLADDPLILQVHGRSEAVRMSTLQSNPWLNYLSCIYKLIRTQSFSDQGVSSINQHLLFYFKLSTIF